MSFAVSRPSMGSIPSFNVASNIPVHVITSGAGNQIIGKALTLGQGALAGEIEGYVNGNVATIGRLFVEDRFRDGAVGKGLFQTFAAVAAEKGARLLQVRTTAEAVGFYEKMGMQQIPNPTGIGILLQKSLPPPPR